MSVASSAGSARSGAFDIVRLLAAGAVMLMLAVTTSSAYIRLSQSGLGCTPWPTCHAAHRAAAAAASTATGTAADAPDLLVARGVHRLAASVALLWVLILVLMGWSALGRARARLPALALPVLAGLLALLGVYSPSPLPAVTVANLLGGFAMLVAAAWVAARLRAVATGEGTAAAGIVVGESPAPAGRPRTLLAACLVALAAQSALGALIDARGAAAVCQAQPLCGAQKAGLDSLRQGLDLFTVAGPAGPDASPGRALHGLHRVLGATVALLALASLSGVAARGTPGRLAAGAAASRARALALLAAALAVAAPASGIAMALDKPTLALAVAHNVLAALLAATLAARLAQAPPLR